jgi:hypothetical protein
MPTRKPLHGMDPEKYQAKYDAHPRREYEVRFLANDEARRARGREALRQRKALQERRPLDVQSLED